MSSLDQVRRCLDRIAEIDAPDTAIALRSVLQVAADAEAVAAQRDRERADGRTLGPLHGVPVMIKDNIDAIGLPATAGSLALVGHPVRRDATLVTRLRDAGAVIVAATNLSEWANIRSSRSSSGWSAVGGLTANPWALDRSTGGSSAGSAAAVAAGLVALAVGTETDGSITCPAALNGVVGIKPTVGLVPTDGVIPISTSQDAPGPLAPTVDQAEALLSVLAGLPDLGERSRAVDVSTLRLGVVEAWSTGHAATDAVFADVIDQIARLFGEVSVSAAKATPDDVHVDEFRVLMCELHDDLASYLRTRSEAGPQSVQDVIDFNLANADRELHLFGQDLFIAAAASGGRAGEGHAGERYAAARARNLDWVERRCFGPAFSTHDVLIAPAYMPAWKTDFVLGHPSAGGAVTSPAAIAGLPTVTIPMGLVAGLPVALSLVGPALSEPVLIAVARVIDRQLALVTDPAWRPTFAQPTRG